VDDQQDQDREPPEEISFSGGVTLPPRNWEASQLETSPDWAGPIHWRPVDGG